MPGSHCCPLSDTAALWSRVLPVEVEAQASPRAMFRVFAARLRQGPALRDVPSVGSTADAAASLGQESSSASLTPDASNLFCIWTGSLQNRSAVFFSLYYVLAFQFC